MTLTQVIDTVRKVYLVMEYATASGPHLDLDRAPYVLYSVKYIDLVSLAPFPGRVPGGHHQAEELPHRGRGQSISNSNITPLFFKMDCKQNLDLRCVLVSAP